MSVNTVTGEIVEPGTDLAPMSRDAASVVSVLENAKTWLTTAVEMTGPEEIAAAKAHIRTAEVYAKELGLSKDIQADAQEMVRRAEYALGKAIRKGQENGTIRTTGEDTRTDLVGRTNYVPKPSPYDFVGKDEMHGNNAGIAELAAAEVEQFEEAITEARQEGNLSRANVVRKVKSQATGHQTRDQRAELIEELAAQGYSSRQMPVKVGVTEESVRQIARDYGIEIPADRSIGKTRRLNSTSVVVNTATALEGLVSGVELIDFAALDVEEVRQWTASLTESMRTLNRFVKQIKETIQ